MSRDARIQKGANSYYLGSAIQKSANNPTTSILDHFRLCSGPIVAIFIGLLSTEPVVAAVAVAAVLAPGTPAPCWRRNFRAGAENCSGQRSSATESVDKVKQAGAVQAAPTPGPAVPS